MRKILSILFLPLFIASGMTVIVNRHYCGGHLVDSKISLTGKLASCGMETDEQKCSNEVTAGNKCCDDQIKFYNISNKFIPEFLKLTDQSPVKNIPAIAEFLVAYSAPDKHDSDCRVHPPGDVTKPGISLSLICVYRI